MPAIINVIFFNKDKVHLFHIVQDCIDFIGYYRMYLSCNVHSTCIQYKPDKCLNKLLCLDTIGQHVNPDISDDRTHVTLNRNLIDIFLEFY